MKKPLKQVIQEQMGSISLDEQQLTKLLQMQHVQPVIGASKKQFKFWSMVTSVMILTIVLSSIFVIYQMNSSTMIQKIANEVAANHLKMKPMEVQATDIVDVQRYFTQLDFLPQESQQTTSIAPQHLIGGRYCSIQGETAAQLRYKDKKGGYVTLFETHYSPELFKQLPDIDHGEKPIVTYARGIKVTLWVEHGLLMVSTE
ncbi:MAG: hypothetical protein KAH22_05380 [Thiotrichaceae bacterium]|nr:hypothetical protein [Thiotrichaceae bacterium]